MSTPNGQHPPDPNGASTQATSTVLALDGWGPVLAEPAPNGANGSEPEVLFDEAQPAVEEAPRNNWYRSVRPGWTYEVPRPTFDSQLIRVVAPLAAMTIAVIAALKLGDIYLSSQVPEPAPSPPKRSATLRRTVALAIDPSLTPVEPERPIWQRWIG